MADCETLHQTTEADGKRTSGILFDAQPADRFHDPRIEALTAQVANLTMIAKKLINANVEIRRKLIELEADMIKPDQRSALILPDQMKGN